MPKIMLLEDDINMLSLLQTLLEMEGFQVVQLNEDQIERLADELLLQKPDLVLMDVHLYHLSGLDMIRQIRQDERLKETCVIMSSGMDYCSECTEAGANGFILKPYMPDELILNIRRAIKAEGIAD